MPRRVCTAKALAVALALIPLSPAAAVPRSEATVLSIGDGDTIRVHQDGKAITERLSCNREGCAFAQA